MPNTSPLYLQDTYAIQENMLGYNMRMTEVQAAILREQLKKLDDFVFMRNINARILNKSLEDIPAIGLTDIPENHTHAYYVQPFFWNSQKANGIHRDTFINAVKAELTGEEGRSDKPLLGNGYIQPLYRMPLFAEQDIHFCPNVELLWKHKLFTSMYHSLPLNFSDFENISDAFHKVWENRGELK
jgi:dTDP-4-amino-4,6-dideoxygalactose transaminase